MTPSIADEAAALAPAGTPVRVVANGCDFDEFDGLEYARGERMRIVHAGSFFGQRTPRPFLAALAALLRERPDLRGRLEAASWASCARPTASGRSGSASATRLRSRASGRTPRRSRPCARADVLLLLVPRAGGRGLSVVSGKVYEYLAAERPILALVPPEGDAATLLRDTGSAWIADPDDEGEILAALRQAADAWLADGLQERRAEPGVARAPRSAHARRRARGAAARRPRRL